jgi:hypothetical protein
MQKSLSVLSVAVILNSCGDANDGLASFIEGKRIIYLGKCEVDGLSIKIDPAGEVVTKND